MPELHISSLVIQHAPDRTAALKEAVSALAGTDWLASENGKAIVTLETATEAEVLDRIADINTPEIGSPECAAEAALGRQATARITLATLSAISPIWSSVTMSGGESAIVSPVTRNINPCSWKPRSMAS